MTRLDWLRARQSGISASDAPNLVGVGFRDAAGVYREKTEPVSDREPTTGPLARGLALEITVAQMYLESLGVECMHRHGYDLKRHPHRSWQTASPDLYRADGRTVQLKTTAGFGDDWGPAGSDEVPPSYRVQVQQEMGVCGQDWCDLAALDVIGWELRVYRIAFDHDFFAWFTAIEERFMTDHLIPRNPPSPNWEAQFHCEAIQRTLTKGTVELAVDYADLCEQRRELMAIRDEADKRARWINGRLMAAMGSNERAIAGRWKLKQTHIAGGEYTATRRPYVRLDVRQSRLGQIGTVSELPDSLEAIEARAEELARAMKEV